MSVSCSKVNELDKRTENMERSTSNMKSSTDAIRDTTITMYLQMRSKEAEDTREKNAEILVGDKANFGRRFKAAGVFFKSFEHQLWNYNSKFDTPEIRELLYTDAANELTKVVSDIYNHIHPSKMTPTDANEKEQTFYALAATIHFNHLSQETFASKNGTTPVSTYDLVKEALVKERNKEKMKKYEDIFMAGINKEMMIELIKARVDVLSVLALKNLTDKRKMTLLEKAKGLVFKVSGGSYGSIDLPEVYDESNSSTKNLTEDYLSGALKAKLFLKEIGVHKQIEKTVLSGLKNLTLEHKTETQEQYQEKSAEDTKKESIKSLIKQLTE